MKNKITIRLLTHVLLALTFVFIGIIHGKVDCKAAAISDEEIVSVNETDADLEEDSFTASEDEELNKEVEASFYLNETGESSEYISKDDCTLLGNGSIEFDKNLDVFVSRNNPEDVKEHIISAPDCSSYLDEGEEIRWMTIYRSHLSYCVIGEIVKNNDGEEEAESEEDLGTVNDTENPEESDLNELLPEDESFDPEKAIKSESDLSINSEEETIDDELSASLLATTSKTYSSYKTLTSATPAEGMTVLTKGYKKSGDGGGASYVISKEKGTISVRLSNKLYANLVIEDTMSPKQFGAVGDGKTDDSEAFKQMIRAGVSTIQIPDGTYNLNAQLLRFEKHITIIGSGTSTCKLTNVSITVPYGVSVRDITCEDGGSRGVWVPGVQYDSSAFFVVSPPKNSNVTPNVEYTNCIFKNAGFASVACNENEKINNDIVTNCQFIDMDYAAIYHSCNEHYTKYTNNVFTNVGNPNRKIGVASAIWIGDVSNVFYTYSDYCEIKNNKFYNLYTQDDFDPDSIHAINANFIAVRAEKAIISNNYIENLSGYGHDREAIYTKVRDLEVTNNEIHDGGTGEGYICNKGVEGDSKCKVTGNILIGEYGCGIRQYGTATIDGNEITIDKCVAAISTGPRKNQTGTWPMDITNNIINCGAGKPYKYCEYTFDNYSSGYVIKIINPINKLTVSGNEIYPTSNYSSYISAGNALKDIVVENNLIKANGRTGNGVLLYTTSDSTANLSQNVKIIGNKIVLGPGQKAVNINFSENNSKRKFTFKNNATNFRSGETKNYGLFMFSGKNNADTVEISGNTSNLKKDVIIVSTPAKKVIMNDERYATLNQKSN